MTLKNHFEFILIEFLCSILKTVNQRYCGKFLFQREKARAEISNTGLRV